MQSFIINLIKHLLFNNEPLEAKIIAEHFSLEDAQRAAKLFDDVLKLKQGQ